MSHVDLCICRVKVKTIDCCVRSLDVIFAYLQVKEGHSKMSQVCLPVQPISLQTVRLYLCFWQCDPSMSYINTVVHFEATCWSASGDVSHTAKVLTCTARCVTTCFCLMAAGLGAKGRVEPFFLRVFLPFRDISAPEIRSVEHPAIHGPGRTAAFQLRPLSLRPLMPFLFSFFFFFLQNEKLVGFRVWKMTSEQPFAVTFITQEITKFKGL